MSALLKLVTHWINGRKPEECDFRDFFKEHLHKEPYFLRYALDKQRENLFMIYMTDDSDRENELVQECNGVILDRNDYSLVAYGMKRMRDMTPEYHGDQFDIPGEKQSEDQKDPEQSVSFEEAEDGAVLTVFHHNGEWIVSTKRSIDANNVRWSSPKNFYQLLSDAVPGGTPSDLFERDLDKGYTHSFILLHPENHLVIPHNRPELIYVSRRNLATLEELNMSTAKLPETMDWARKRQSLSRDQALKRLQDARPQGKRGIIINKRSKVGDGDHWEYDRIYIDYKWFSEANNLRKGQPTLHLSYLACGPQEKQKMRSFFGNQLIFDVIDDLLGNLVRYTFAVYKDSYVRKKYKVDYNHPICKTLRKLHYDYKTTGEPVKMNHVVSMIDSIPINVLDSMLLYFSTYGFYAPEEQPQQQSQLQPQQGSLPTSQIEQKSATVAMEKRIDDDETEKVAINASAEALPETDN